MDEEIARELQLLNEEHDREMQQIEAGLQRWHLTPPIVAKLSRLQ